MRKNSYSFILGIVTCILCTANSWGATTKVTVSWGAITSDNVAGYQVVWGLSSKNYTNSVDVGNVNQTGIDVDSGSRYYFAVRGVDKQGRLGVLSNAAGTQLSSTKNRKVGSRAIASSNAVFVSSVKETELFRTNLGINNPSETTANVDMALVDRDGIIQGVKSLDVPAGGMVQINGIINDINGDGTVKVTDGNLILESDQIISAWASEIDNQTNDPSLLLSKKSGATRLLIPSAANTGSWTSSLVVQNLGSTDASISITAYTPDGQILASSQADVVVPACGVVTYENILSALGATSGYGPLEIVSTNEQPLIATSRVAGNSGAGGFFEAAPSEAAANSQVVPYLLENGTIRTNLGINNGSNQLANVTLRFINSNGMELARSTTSVVPHGLKQLNSNELLQIINQGAEGTVECYVRVDSDQPVLSWASQIENSTNDPGFSMGRNLGGYRFLVPSAVNTINWSSSLVIVNPNAEPAYVDIVARDSDGGVQGRLMGLLIPAAGFFSHDNVLAYLGIPSGFGPVEVSSPIQASPLMVTSRVCSINKTSGFFEGQVLE